jgi:hypothetical protein
MTPKYAILQLAGLRNNTDGNLDQDECNARSRLEIKAIALCANDAMIVKLGEYCWLFPLPISLPPLSALIDFAHISKLEYRVAYLDDLQWLEFNKK